MSRAPSSLATASPKPTVIDLTYGFGFVFRVLCVMNPNIRSLHPFTFISGNKLKHFNPHDVGSYLAAAGLGRENPHYIVRDYS